MDTFRAQHKPMELPELPEIKPREQRMSEAYYDAGVSPTHPSIRSPLLGIEVEEGNDDPLSPTSHRVDGDVEVEVKPMSDGDDGSSLPTTQLRVVVAALSLLTEGCCRWTYKLAARRDLGQGRPPQWAATRTWRCWRWRRLPSRRRRLRDV